jgi:hypothetical protein
MNSVKPVIYTRIDFSLENKILSSYIISQFILRSIRAPFPYFVTLSPCPSFASCKASGFSARACNGKCLAISYRGINEVKYRKPLPWKQYYKHTELTNHESTHLPSFLFLYRRKVSKEYGVDEEKKGVHKHVSRKYN